MNNPGQGAPYSYDYINQYNSCFSPSTVHAMGTGQYRIFYRIFMQRAMSVFKWSMPENWEDNYALYCLYEWGYFVVFNSRTYGVIPQGCTLYGYNVMYQPTYAIVSNPIFKDTLYVKLNVNGVLIKLQPDYGGVFDIVNYYACMCALMTESIDINLLNTHLSYIFATSTKANAEAWKKVYDKIAGGEPAVFVDKNMFDSAGNLTYQMFTKDVKSSYIVSDLLDDLQKVFAMFDTEIGIPNLHEKSERMLQDEVNKNTTETYTKVDMWYQNIQKSIRKCKKMFPGLELSCEWRVKNEGSVYNGNGTIQGGQQSI